MATEERKTYNGWANYETWNAKLWMDNEEPSYRYWREQAENAYRNAEADDIFTRAERAALDLDDILKAEHEEAMPDLGASMFADILSAAFGEINWHEIATSLIEDIDEDVKAEIDAEDEDA